MFDFVSIDWGEKRVGLAYGDSQTGLIIPDKENRENHNFFEYFSQILEQKKITNIVVGLPTNFELGETVVTKKILEFVELLKKSYPEKNIYTVNERNSTKESKNLSELSADKFSINHLSAANILQYYFNE